MKVTRRPSDNLLPIMIQKERKDQPSRNASNSLATHNMTNEQNNVILRQLPEQISTDLLPPKSTFMGKPTQRPISEDSIATRTTEIFSSEPSDTNSESSISNDDRHHKLLAFEGESDLNDTMDYSMLSIDTTGNNGNMTDFNIDTFSTVDTLTSPVNQSRTVISRNATLLGNTSEVSRTNSYSQASTNSKASSNNNGPSETAYNSKFINRSASFLHSSSTQPTHLPLNYANNFTTSNLPMTSQKQPNYPYTRSNSTSNILPMNNIHLTPSQRYRLRKEQSNISLRQSIRRKEKYYDKLELQEEDDVDNSFIWNIPIASFPTSSFISSTPDLPSTKMKKSHQHRRHITNAKKFPTPPDKETDIDHPLPLGMKPLNVSLPPTSIPGINPVSDSQYFEETVKDLSSVYIDTSEKLKQSKLRERYYSADHLPLSLKHASDCGMEDLLLISPDKINLMSSSRPSWLPPKDSHEDKIHGKLISRSMSLASVDQLKYKQIQESYALKDKSNQDKYLKLLEKDINKKSSLNELKKLIWETPIPNKLRLTIYEKLLESDSKIISQHFIEPFDEAMLLLNRMDFPKDKEFEIEQLIKNGIQDKIGGYDSRIHDDLILLLELKSISQQGLIVGDELLFHHLLLTSCLLYTSRCV